MAAVKRKQYSRPSTHKESLHVANLEPLKRKLDRIETERIYRIIQCAVSNIRQAKLVSWFLEDDANIFRVTDEDLRQLLLRHQHVAGTRLPDEGKQKIENSLKFILRYCTENSVNLSSYLSDNLSEYNSVIVEHFEELVKIVFERLLTESNEEVARSKFLLQTMEKMRSARNAIVALQQNLKDRLSETERVINEKDCMIRQLMHDLQSVKVFSEDENNTTLNGAAKQILQNQKLLEHKRNKLTKDIILFREEAWKTSYEKESKLRKRKFKMTRELENWILKYDQDMGWRQEQIDEITELNQEEVEQISEIEKHFNILEKEYDAIVEERRVKAEDKKKREQKEGELKDASVKIQCIWRGYQTRRDLKGKKSGKKGAKAGGKKKGKGGKKKK